MPTDFTRGNKDLEARIAQCKSALEISQLLAEVPVTDILRGATPAPAASSRPVGTRLQKTVQTPDGREIVIHADSYYGLDILEEGVRSGQITKSI